MNDRVVYGMVMGSGEFPLDMLRYDSCSPAKESDSSLIASTFRNYDKWTIFVKRILLERRKKDDKIFTTGRWESFGCKITEVDSPNHQQLNFFSVN